MSFKKKKVAAKKGAGRPKKEIKIVPHESPDNAALIVPNIAINPTPAKSSNNLIIDVDSIDSDVVTETDTSYIYVCILYFIFIYKTLFLFHLFFLQFVLYRFRIVEALTSVEATS